MKQDNSAPPGAPRLPVEAIPDPNPNPEEALIAKEELPARLAREEAEEQQESQWRRILAAAIGNLPARQRDIVLLVEYPGDDEPLTLAEAADRMGCSRQAAHKAHKAAIQSLKRMLTN